MKRTGDRAYILAHDVGTTGTKAVLVRPDGSVAGCVRTTYPVYYPQPGWAEQEPDDWWAALCHSTRQLLNDCAVQPSEVVGMISTAQLLGIVPVDPAGQPLRRAIIWLDARAQAQAEQLMRKLLGRRLFTLIAGATASGKDVVPKLLWLKQHEPALFARTTAFLDVNGYLLARATGQQVIDWSAASATGLFDLRHKQWNALLIRLCGLPFAKLPRLCRAGEIVGGLRQQAADELGLCVDTAVLCGAGDVPIAAVGAGATDDGAGHIYLGTSGWVGVTTSKLPRSTSGVATLQAADPQMFLRMAETETAGACAQWLQSVLFHTQSAVDPAQPFAAIDAAIQRVQPGAERLLFTPWLYGERAPIADVFARAAFINLGPQHTHEHMARAVYEGVAYNLRWILELMWQNNDYRYKPLRIIGGGAQSDVWMQIIADITGTCIERVAAAREAGAVGAALLAVQALGMHDPESAGSLIRVECVFEPQQRYSARYDQLYTVFKHLYPALKPIYQQLNRSLGVTQHNDADS